MSLPRFFLHDQVLSSETSSEFPLRLSPEDCKHARVLRLKTSEHIAVIDASGDYFELELTNVDDDFPLVRIAAHESSPVTGPSVMLVQGLAKGDKMDEVFRHATELGVQAFMPLLCSRSVVKLDSKKTASKMNRWNAIVKSAAMQSGQLAIPEVLPPHTVQDAANALAQATTVLVCWEEAQNTHSLRAAIAQALNACSCPAADARVAVVVGPEGGLTSEEVDAFLTANKRASLISLGPTILRTETAGIVASALTLYELGGLGNRPA